MDGYQGSLSRMSEKEIEFLAHAIRSYEDGWDELSDEEVIQRKVQEIEEQECLKDSQYAREESKRQTY